MSKKQSVEQKLLYKAVVKRVLASDRPSKEELERIRQEWEGRSTPQEKAA